MTSTHQHDVDKVKFLCKAHEEQIRYVSREDEKFYCRVCVAEGMGKAARTALTACRSEDILYHTQRLI